jgi:hypothetical protein
VAKEQPASAGDSHLLDILSAAIAGGADAVELERDSGGSLEVILLSGNTGGGFALGRTEGQSLIDSIFERIRVAHGRFRLQVGGKDYMIQVKTYDHFGEDAFRLTWREAKR